MRFIQILLFFLSFQITAQTEDAVKDALNKINNIEDFELVEYSNPNWDMYYMQVSNVGFATDSTIVSSPLMSVHEKFLNQGKDKYLLKVLSKEKKEFCKLRYILVNSKNSSASEINHLQDKIIQEYKTGKTIQELVETYNQDGNPTGDLDWFNKKMMVSEFEEAVWEKEKDAIIKVNIPSRNWHYVVFKTHSNIVEDVANCARIKICHVGCPNSELEMPEIEAVYPGGLEALSTFIARTVEYPEQAIKDNIQGKVFISFIVEIDGSISNLTIEKGVNDDLNNESIRILNLMPKWTPATHHGKKVRSKCQLPINFVL